MLAELIIHDIVLIDELQLELGTGLNVLTGETGAGKSILLDSLGLATGARADKGLIRQGKAKGSVTALFEIPESHPALALLHENDIVAETNGETHEIILRRVQNADGRSRQCFQYITPVRVIGLLHRCIEIAVRGKRDRFNRAISRAVVAEHTFSRVAGITL